MKTHMLGAGKFIKFIFTCDKDDMWNEADLNCRNTEENGDVIIAVATANFNSKKFSGLQFVSG